MKFLLLSLGLGYLLFSNEVLSFEIEKRKEDDDSVGAMTTLEPIDSREDENCALYLSCEECMSQNCTWIRCPSTDACDKGPDELCPPALSCNKDTTTAQPTTVPVNTTTDNPETNQTTTLASTTYQSTTFDPVTNQTTTETPSTTNATTTNQPSTTEPVTSQPTTNYPTTASPTNLPTTKQPDTTIEPVTDPTTLSTSTSTSTTTAVPAHPGHFDAASFVGGIILCASLTAAGYAGYKFYLRRSLAPSYSNF